MAPVVSHCSPEQYGEIIIMLHPFEQLQKTIIYVMAFIGPCENPFNMEGTGLEHQKI